jgi:hypothetical protein
MTPFKPRFGPGFPEFEILRLRPMPDAAAPVREPAAPVREPARGRPHGGSAIDRMRTLVETTPLSYREIARQTGLSIATISRRAKAGGWVRPETHVPVEHYTEDGRRILKRRELAARLMHQAERRVRELEADPFVNADTLARAMRLAKAAKALDEVDQGKAKRGKRKARG